MKALVVFGAGTLLLLTTTAAAPRSERVARYNTALNAATLMAWCASPNPGFTPAEKWRLQYQPLRSEIDEETIALERKYGRRGLKKMLILVPPGVVLPYCRGEDDASRRFDDLDKAMKRMRELKQGNPA